MNNTLRKPKRPNDEIMPQIECFADRNETAVLQAMKEAGMTLQWELEAIKTLVDGEKTPATAKIAALQRLDEIRNMARRYSVTQDVTHAEPAAPSQFMAAVAAVRMDPTDMVIDAEEPVPPDSVLETDED